MERDPFKSQAQRRKFAQLLVEGKISNQTFERVESRDGERAASRARQAEGQVEVQAQGQGQAQAKIPQEDRRCPFVAWPPSHSLCRRDRARHRQRQSPTTRPLPRDALADDRPAPRRTHESRGGNPRPPNVFYVGAVNGGVWKSADYGDLAPDLRRSTDRLRRRIAIAPRARTSLRRQRRGPAAAGPLDRDGIYKSTDGGKTGAISACARAPDPTDRRRPARSEPAVRGRLGSPYGPARARPVPLHRRRRDSRRSSTATRTRAPSTSCSTRRPAHGLRRVVGVTAGAVGERRLQRAGQRALQVHGRWGDLEAAHEGAAQLRRRRPRPDRITVAPSDPRRLYATVEAKRNGGLYRSDDAGESWARVNADLAWPSAGRTSRR